MYFEESRVIVCYTNCIIKAGEGEGVAVKEGERRKRNVFAECRISMTLAPTLDR